MCRWLLNGPKWTLFASRSSGCFIVGFYLGEGISLFGVETTATACLWNYVLMTLTWTPCVRAPGRWETFPKMKTRIVSSLGGRHMISICLSFPTASVLATVIVWEFKMNELICDYTFLEKKLSITYKVKSPITPTPLPSCFLLKG